MFQRFRSNSDTFALQRNEPDNIKLNYKSNRSVKTVILVILFPVTLISMLFYTKELDSAYLMTTYTNYEGSEPSYLYNLHDSINDKTFKSSDSELYPYFLWDKRVENSNAYLHHHYQGIKQTSTRSITPPSMSSSSESIVKNLQHEPLNILALGGSITWGGSIANRYDAYPFLLSKLLHPKSRIDNLAIRATGATYFASCIQSILEGDDGAFPEYEVYPSRIFNVDSAIDTTSSPIIYDIILLEFSVNGESSTDFLIKRLQKRFPNAIMIYIHLHSLQHPPQSYMTLDYFESLMHPVNGLVAMFPYQEDYTKENIYSYSVARQKGGDSSHPDYLSLYADDQHHLSEIGHKFVANMIMTKLNDHFSRNMHLLELLDNKLLGDWGTAGDQCYMWVSSWGYFPKSITVSASPVGSAFRVFDELKKKYSYEIEYGSNATFIFGRKEFYVDDIPIHLMYMTKGDPPLYPKAMVQISTHVNSNVKSDNYVVDPRNDPYFSSWSWAHITRPEIVGLSRPGLNSITVTPLEKTTYPFRLVGIILCGACVEEYKDSHSSIVNNIRVRVPE